MSGPAQNIHNIYDPLWEHDACGIGAVVNLKGHAVPTPQWTVP